MPWIWELLSHPLIGVHLNCNLPILLHHYIVWCWQREKIDWQEPPKFDCLNCNLPILLHHYIGWCQQREKNDWQEPPKFDCWLVRTIFIFCCWRVGWCQEREKIDWQEPRKFDCRLVRTIFIFCCPLSIFTRHPSLLSMKKMNYMIYARNTILKLERISNSMWIILRNVLKQYMKKEINWKP